MKKHKIKTEELFSTEALINVLSDIQAPENRMKLLLDIEFKNAVVEIVGDMRGYYHDVADDVPQYTDLYDMELNLYDVKIKYINDYIKKRVRSLMLN